MGIVEEGEIVYAREFGVVNFILNDPNLNWKRKAGEFIERVEKQLRRLLDGVDEIKEE